MTNVFNRECTTNGTVTRSEVRDGSSLSTRQKQSEIPTTSHLDQVVQTEHPTERVVYVDNPPPKQPNAATKALVRNLNSSSVQQHMLWDAGSLSSERTKSDTYVCPGLSCTALDR